MHSQRAETRALDDAASRRADDVIEQSLNIFDDLRGHVMVAPFQGLIDWARKNSLCLTFGLDCCAIESNSRVRIRGLIWRDSVWTSIALRRAR